MKKKKIKKWQIFYAILAALVISFFTNLLVSRQVQCIQIKVGDYLFVSKFSYGFSETFTFSIPLIPGRIFYKDPKRGDVVVFKTPEDNRTDYIKRLIVSGDKISINQIKFFKWKKIQSELINNETYKSFDVQKIEKLTQSKILFSL